MSKITVEKFNEIFERDSDSPIMDGDNAFKGFLIMAKHININKKI